MVVAQQNRVTPSPFDFGLSFEYLNISGGYDGSYRDNIYELDQETGEWNNVANMEVARHSHAVSIIDLTNLRQYCK